MGPALGYCKDINPTEQIQWRSLRIVFSDIWNTFKLFFPAIFENEPYRFVKGLPLFKIPFYY